MTTTTPKARSVFESRTMAEPQVDQVTAVKEAAATLYDRIQAITVTSGEAGRLLALSQTSLEETVMWATKAASRFNPSTLL